MLTRKRRTAQQRAWLKVKQAAPLGIGSTHTETKGAALKALAAHIAAVRAQVFTRDGQCRVSGLKSDDFDELHEDPSRAKSRGLPMDERFNSRVCIRLNREIHRLVTEKQIQIVKVDPVLGFDGEIRVICVEKEARRAR